MSLPRTRMSRHKPSSPSVTLEKGEALLYQPNQLRRPANIRNIRNIRASPSMSKGYGLQLPRRRTLSVILFLLLVFLIFGIFFLLRGTRLRWDNSQTQKDLLRPTTHAPTPEEVYIRFRSPRPPDVDQRLNGDNYDSKSDDALLSDALSPPLPVNDTTKTRKYLAYLPHSGFHNQRIAFENALVLARALDRTLLVPPVRLGVPLSYFGFEKLERALVLGNDRSGLEHCARVPLGVVRPVECVGYDEFTLVSWAWIVDYEGLRAQQDLVERWDMSSEWLEETLGIKEGDVKVFEDSQPYQWRIYDSLDDTQPLKSNYAERLDLCTLKALSDYRLIQFGTLFGTTRLRLVIPENVAARKQVRERMVFKMDALLHIADAIRDGLGGPDGWGYVGVHLRLGDGLFRRNSTENLRLVWWKLATQALGINATAAAAVEARAMGWESDGETYLPPAIVPDKMALRTPHPPPPPPPLNATASHTVCRGALHTSSHLLPLNTPIFIATDVPAPRSHPDLQLFVSTFPCTFFLSDFDARIRALFALRNADDGVALGPFLLPFLDAMVAAKGRETLGTPHSTFSRFTVDVLSRVYHGWDIVQRG
ncbi:hypothetical protein BOTBODRAFT_180673 [Botryobasidium botryosum FD-172 SS1]|uniref:CigA protein n=1 Tax=Botryobasidium botryosum (strain FD-172 SS1) TaxID=930990 RepID=A0A067M7D7_BOTB1|nr:hypothetical protein BOTBODRAFT_180673 [Botryobasidium botryosum FD-172 SS1]